MRFSSVKALVGWAFQMESTVMCRVAKYGESSSPAFGGLSMADQRTQAAMVMAKVLRLPFAERTVLWAFFVGDDAHLMVLADRLSVPMSIGTRVELVRHWVGEGEATPRGRRPKSGRMLAEREKVSESTMTRAKQRVQRECNALFGKALAVIEVQCLPLLVATRQERFHREDEKSACAVV
ncbi:hypothetical protein [Jeongeupia sp. USM3]|uniref:hypothetical protein n=1 Tax=Jeongeupia sp. USM3 TaxID=1906741 RepID=UPI0011AB5507|nr:hypothetical protein [Jeongeupia sp. USM3]